MAAIYVRSTDGSDADNGSTWALAKATLTGAAAIDAAGDTIYVSDNHAESTAAAITFAFAGTAASPVRVICGDDAAEPPTTAATTATVSTTGASGITVNGSVYTYGITFNCGTGASAGILTLSANGGEIQRHSHDTFALGTTSNGAVIRAGLTTGGAVGDIFWDACDVSFSAAGQAVEIGAGSFEWHGGSVLSGSTPTTNGLIKCTVRISSAVLVDSVDMSACSSSLNLCSSAGSGLVIFRDCKLPASWAGSLVTGTVPIGFRAEMHNCDASDTNYTLVISEYAGSILSDTGVYNDAGASDGTTRLSWKMVTAANAEYPVIHLESPEIVRWNDTTGSAITVTVEIVHNSQGSGTNGVLNDDECWLEVMYLGTAGYPLGTWITDCKSDALATAAAQATSSAAWTGDAAGWDTQKLSVTFTPQEKGFIHARVVLAKASATVYVDPLLTVS